MQREPKEQQSASAKGGRDVSAEEPKDFLLDWLSIGWESAGVT